MEKEIYKIPTSKWIFTIEFRPDRKVIIKSTNIKFFTNNRNWQNTTKIWRIQSDPAIDPEKSLQILKVFYEEQNSREKNKEFK